MEDKAKFYFKRVPSKILKADNLLDNTDRGLLVRISLFHPNPCFLSVNYLTEKVLGCGEKAFYRSVLKLQFLGLIEFKRGKRARPNRKNPNTYTLIDDPTQWRLPQPLADEIKVDFAKLGFGDLIFKKDPFPNELGFKIAFNKTHPSYLIKIKSEVDNVAEEEAPKISIRETLSATEQRFFDLLDLLDSPHITNSKIIGDYFKNKNKIEMNRSKTNTDFGVFESKYYLHLEEKFFEASNDTKDSTRALLNLATNLEAKGVNGEEIQSAIKAEAKKIREKEVAEF